MALAFAKREGMSFRSPWISLMVGLLEVRAVAEAEVGLRVTARIVMSSVLEVGDSRRASMVAPPCLPVAPVMRRPLDILVVLILRRWGWRLI